MLDIKDKKLLSLLSLNSRLPVVQIAKKLRLSKDAVSHRIKRLEKQGIIQNYPTIIDFQALGRNVFRVHLKFIDCLPKEEAQVIKYLVNKDEVLFVQETEGNWDLAFGVLVKSVSAFTLFWKNFVQQFKPKIKDHKTTIYETIKHYPRKYLAEVKTQNKKRSSPITLQEKDNHILKLLSANARMSSVEIGQKLNIPATTVAYRIKLLEKSGIIESYTTNIDVKKIGFLYLKLELCLRDMKTLSVIEAIAENSLYAVHLVKTIGGSDLEIIYEVPSMQVFLKEVNTIREQTKNIREWTYISLRKYHKFTYF